MTQLICVGGSAGCDYGIQPHVIQCHNRGFDGYNMQVKGKSLMSLYICVCVVYINSMSNCIHYSEYSQIPNPMQVFTITCCVALSFYCVVLACLAFVIDD